MFLLSHYSSDSLGHLQSGLGTHQLISWVRSRVKRQRFQGLRQWSGQKKEQVLTES
ncbi:MAG: hypothetical protein JKX87_07440 [Cycloclasticus sp.]|nr:hypothetical protein [Cycloclasticus sp.]